MFSILKRVLPSVVSTKLISFWQFIKAQAESEKTTIYSKNLNSKNNKISVVFIIYFAEAFSSFKSLYELLRADNDFDVHLLCQPNFSDNDWSNHNAAYSFLSALYPEAINAYKNKKWFALNTLSPDYVFYCRPYNSDYYTAYKASVVREVAKVCFIAYSYNLEHKHDHNFNTVNNYDFLQNCYYIFATTEYERSILRKRFVLSSMRQNYPKILFAGFTRFDLYCNKKESSLPRKNKPFTILYTPRWTSYKKIKSQGSSFLLYIDNFIDYARQNSDIQIIIRLHPLMIHHYIAENIVSPDYFEKLENTFRQLGNIRFDTSKDYFDSLEKADAFISDYTSLLVEFFISRKPVIYLGNVSLFNKNTKKMCQAFYKANSWNEINNFIEQLKNGCDLFYEKRNRLFPKIIKSYGKASENIRNILKNNFYEKGERL